MNRALSPIGDPQKVEVKNPSGKLWPTNLQFIASTQPLRYGPAIHVNQVGYVASFPKQAMIGYYHGRLGEMNVPLQLGFALVDAATGAEVYRGSLTPRADVGYDYDPVPYQNVLQADFSDFATPGEITNRAQGDMPDFGILPAGATSATLVIVPIDDALVEGPEKVILTLTAIDAYHVGSRSSATVTIADNDVRILGREEIRRLHEDTARCRWKERLSKRRSGGHRSVDFGQRFGVDDPFGDGVAGEAGHLVDAQLVHDRLPVFFDGFDAQIKFRGNLFVAEALRH